MMFDLKAKLLDAGLVTKEQIAKVESKNHRKPKIKKTKPNRSNTSLSFEEKERARHVQELKSLSKPEQYELIRKWVARNRLDKPANLVVSDLEKFFFEGNDKSVSWLSLERNVHEKVTSGDAGIVAFMSNHGLAHCVLPREIVEDIAQVFPSWLRVLKEKNATLDPKSANG